MKLTKKEKAAILKAAEIVYYNEGIRQYSCWAINKALGKFSHNKTALRTKYCKFYNKHSHIPWFFDNKGEVINNEETKQHRIMLLLNFLYANSKCTKKEE